MINLLDSILENICQGLNVKLLMKGFEIEFQDKKIVIASEGNTFLFFTSLIKPDENDCIFTNSGANHERNERYKWGNIELKEGDVFKIRVIETNQPSPPKIVEQTNDEADLLKGKLHSFKNLEIKLKEKGLI